MLRNIFCLLTVLALTAALGLSACEWVKIPGSPKCKKEDVEPVQQIGQLADDENCVETDTGLVEYKGPFRHRWWHYYNRAQCFLQKGCLQGAIDDLNIAISQRSKDQWNARTYGMHFMDYFPNRELGIAYYYQAKNEADEFNAVKKMLIARMALNRSIKWTPSAKAIYYIGECYKELFAKDHLLEKAYEDLLAENQDLDGDDIKISKTKPRITLNEPKITDGIRRTADDPVTFSGYVEDENFITSISINDHPVFLLNSSTDIDLYKNLDKRIYFRHQMSLSHGKEKITIKAKNITGESATPAEETILVDQLSPIVEIRESYKTTDEKNIVVSGTVHDAVGLSYVLINEKRMPVHQDGKFFFNETVSTDIDKPIRVIAYDTLGNQTVAETNPLPFDKKNSVLLAWNKAGDNLFADNNRLKCREDLKIKRDKETKIDVSAKFLVNGQIREKKLEEEGAIDVNDKIEAYLGKIPINVTIIQGENDAPIDEIVVNGLTEFKDNSSNFKDSSSDNPANIKRHHFCFGYVIDLRREETIIEVIHKEAEGKIKQITKRMIPSDNAIAVKDIVEYRNISTREEDYSIRFDTVERDNAIKENRLEVLVNPFPYYKGNTQMSKGHCTNSDEYCQKTLSFLRILSSSIRTLFDYITFHDRFQVPENELFLIIDDANKEEYLKKIRKKYSQPQNHQQPKRIAIIGEIKEGYILNRGMGIEVKAYLFDTEYNAENRISDTDLSVPIDAFITSATMKGKEIDRGKAMLEIANHLANKYSLEFPSVLGNVIQEPEPGNNVINTSVIDHKLKIKSRLIPVQTEKEIFRPMILHKEGEFSIAEVIPPPADLSLTTEDKLITE